jgi:hypothetical protein
VLPNGPNKGQRVVLTPAQREIVYQVYDTARPPPVTDVLAAYLALLHVCGPEAKSVDCPQLASDFFTVWNATGPDLRPWLKRDGAAVVCPEFGTRYPAANFGEHRISVA